jgi:hypothetical protein
MTQNGYAGISLFDKSWLFVTKTKPVPRAGSKGLSNYAFDTPNLYTEPIFWANALDG